MKITAPYYNEKEVKVASYDTHDKVERSGYVSNEKKIDTFIQTGMVLQNMHMGGDEYEIQGEETDNEPDSKEYLEELTQDAENFTEKPLEQYMDKITAEETLADAEMTMETAKKKPKKQKEPSVEDSVIKAITEGFDKISSKATQTKDEPSD